MGDGQPKTFQYGNGSARLGLYRLSGGAEALRPRGWCPMPSAPSWQEALPGFRLLAALQSTVPEENVSEEIRPAAVSQKMKPSRWVLGTNEDALANLPGG